MNLIRNDSFGAIICRVAVLLILVAGAGVHAEKIGRGTYHGYFCENRWGQKVFHHGPYHYFVAESAMPRLKPHEGKPVEVEVAEISQPMNPGAGMIKKVGKVSPGGMAEELTLSATLKSAKVAPGEGVTVAVTLSNISEETIQETFTVGKELLPDDYEVFALLTPSYKSSLVGPISKRLAFDVVAPEVVLDAGDGPVEKVEVRHSMLGVRDTLVFYTFPEQKAVLRVRIGNADTKFPIEAVVHTFASDATAEGVGKWVNNQHSDALFIDAAKPTAAHKIPQGLLKIESHRKTGRSKQHNGEFDDYEVKFRIGDFAPKTGLKLKGFTGEATVHVKAG